jgi:hypothetical protein
MIARTFGGAIAAILASSAFAQCGNQASCLEEHDTPGCVVIECCNAVCEANPLCCDVSWDADCVGWADKLCDGLTCPSPGGCESVHFEPGCEDTDCCQLACRFDWYCCYTAWDSLCVQVASSLCGESPCTIEIPANAVDEGEPCFEHFNDGCNLPDASPIPIAPGAVRTGKYASGAPRDTDWYSLSLTTPTRLAIRLRAEFPGQILVMKGPCLGPFETRADVTALPCAEALVDECFEPGDYSIIVAAALPDQPLRYSFTCDEEDPDNPPDPKEPAPEPSYFGLRYLLTVDGGSCTFGDLDGDGLVGPTDLGILLGAWGGAGSADLDGDGTVGPSDLGILLGAWSA